MRKAGTREQIRCDETAGAVKGRLPEREEPGKAEQDVESNSEQAPDQDAIYGVGCEAEMRQDEWRHDQSDRRQRFN